MSLSLEVLAALVTRKTSKVPTGATQYPTEVEYRLLGLTTF